MNNSLIIPFRIEALFLNDDDSVSFAGPSLDFKQLPYYTDSNSIANRENPLIGETISKNAFEGSTQMPKGLHLHFILPQFLGKTIPKRCSEVITAGTQVPAALKSGSLPAAPNRWCVKKTENSNIFTYWIIQSDYIYSPQSDPDNINFQSIIANKFTSADGKFPLPYCYLGTNNLVENDLNDFYPLAGKIDLSANDGTSTFKTLQGKPLTILGSGDPYFSAYYANCLSVFGFLDNTITQINSSDPITYEIFGWHDDYNDDSIFQFIKYLSSQGENDFIEQLKSNFSINIADKTVQSIDIGPCIYYAKKIIDGTPVDPDYSNVNITVGRSVNEAVSAYLSKDAPDKSRMEEQLESISLIRNFDHLTTDVAFKLKEARHAQGFKKIDGGSRWLIIPNENSSTINSPDNKLAVDLPEKYIYLLDTLNKSQSNYDIAVNELTSLKEQLYVDYINCQKAYQTLNEAKDEAKEDVIDEMTDIKNLYKSYSESKLSEEIKLCHANLGKLLSISNGQIEAIDEIEDAKTAKILYNAWQAVHKEMILDGLQDKWTLKQSPNDAYWQPKAPAVLISGLQEDHTLESLFTENKKAYLEAFVAKSFDSSDPLTFIKQLIPSTNSETNSITSQADIIEHFDATKNKMINYSNQVNTHFLLKWHLEINMNYPDTTNPNWNFDPSFLSSYPNPNGGANSFGLAFGGSEFDFSNSNTVTTLQDQNINIASTSILSHSGRKGMLLQMIHYLKTYLKKNSLEKLISDAASFENTLANTSGFTENNMIAAIVYGFANQSLSDFKATLSIIQTHLPSITFSLPIHEVVIQSMVTLLNSNFIAQTLSGFNHACLQRNITAQLPLPGNVDPFNSEYDLTNINNALNIEKIDYEKTSPDADVNVFLPIQVGIPKFIELFLIDNFGKYHSLPMTAEGGNDFKSINYAESMKVNPEDPNGFLFPRISQASRIEFNWLTANDNPWIDPAKINLDPNDDTSYSQDLFDTNCKFTNSVEASSPICGWIIPDYFNKELMVYDSNGYPLGYLDENATWRIPPFLRHKEDIDLNIQNEHLKRVVQWMLADPTTKSVSKLNKMMDCLELAAQYSIPSQKHHYNSKALLMGNPIAVVRGAVRFRVKGLAAINQSRTDSYRISQELYITTKDKPSYADFLEGQTIGYKDRSTNNWEKMTVYLRLGEANQYGDGLYGYWDDSMPGTFYSSFYMPPSDDSIISLADPINTNSIGLNEMQFFTFLMDPRSGLHLTSGILPTEYKTLELHHYEQALKNMAMWFKVSALIQPTNSLKSAALINLPKVPGYAWHLYDQFNGLRAITADELDTNSTSDNTITESYIILKS